MSAAEHFLSLGKTAKIVVWVEDTLSREYLNELWGDSDIGFLISGNIESIRGATNAARAEGVLNMFGVCDRDFFKSNYDKWEDPNSGAFVFVLPRHEIENFLLDATAIENCPENVAKRQHAAIQEFMFERAKKQTAAMACRALIAWLRTVFMDGFPFHPSISDVDDPKKIASYVFQTEWFKSIGSKISGLSQSDIESRASQMYEQMSRRLGDGTWKVEFSGKEIFNAIASDVHSGRCTDGDLAKSIGVWQRENDQTPEELVSLRRALRKKVNLPAS